MPAIRDKERGTWIAQFYYTNSEGQRKRKRKRGFRLKREALEYEYDFLANHKDDISMTFENFTRLYLEDIRYRIKESSFEQKKYVLEKKVLPYFKGWHISNIKPKDIRKWQNTLLGYRNKEGKGYANTYLKSIYNQLNAVFNFAVRFYDLKENPCIKAGSIGQLKGETKNIWTLNDFYKFCNEIKDYNPAHEIAIETLFFSGLRIGELLALTPKDIDYDKNIIHVTKTFSKLHGKEIISDPKTKKSKRDVHIPKSLSNNLREYVNNNYFKINEKGRLFPFTSGALNYSLKTYSDKANVPKIRIHDLRHSHTSLLVDLGFNANLIADRLGHEKIETTLGIYTHLYPKKRREVSDKLETLTENPFFNK